MTLQKNNFNAKQIKAHLSKELNFLKNVFSILSLPTQMKGDEDDDILSEEEVSNDAPQTNDDKELQKRARNIAELEEKLEKIKSQNKFNLKSKLAKKSLNSKLNKKIKKRERLNTNKLKSQVKLETSKKKLVPEKPKDNIAKPVFNTDGKLVFSKFDFSNIGNSHSDKKRGQKDPKKLLENIKQQEDKFRHLEETQDATKVKEVKEKVAWKNILQKAEGLKIKDDPNLLKKSIKKMEQKKRQSKKLWDNRIQNVKDKKEERQKKRTENISKKKKEKKSKIVKASAKRGRVVI